MALVSSKGAFVQRKPNQHNNDLPETQFVAPNNIDLNNYKNQSELANIEDTFTDQSAFNMKRFNDQLPLLMGFQKGSPHKVTYFCRNNTEEFTRSIISEVDLNEHVVHTSLRQIKNFEIRITSTIEKQEPEDGESEIDLSFAAVLYPGFVPTVGDFLILDIGDYKFGLFEVTECDKMSHRQNAYHTIQCRIKTYLNAKLVEYLNKCSEGDVVYFDKYVWFHQNFTFVKQESFVQVSKLRKLRAEIIDFYMDNYYRKSANSFFRPDDLYDPYIVHLLNTQLGLDDIHTRPKQFITNIPNLNKSVIGFLMNPNIHRVDNLISHYTVDTYSKTAFNTDINYLLNKRYITLQPYEELTTSQKPYIFGDKFYSDQHQLMTDLEHLVYTTKTIDKFDWGKLVLLVEQYSKSSLDDNFYNIPIYIYLINLFTRRAS